MNIIFLYYKGQLGTGDTKYQHKMVPIFTGNTRSKIVDISAGFQHTIMLSGNYLRNF